jgi:hypothetical protein
MRPTSWPDVSSDLGATPEHSWRIAEQYFKAGDFEIEMQPHNDGCVMTIKSDHNTRCVYFDPAGRVTHVWTRRQ